jgi:hypothetical protein
MENQVTYNKGEFSYLPTSERLKINDEPATRAARRYFRKKGIPLRIHGFDKTTERIWEFPAVLRHRPDLWIKTEGKDYLCEVKGCGSAGVVRVWFDKLESYKVWEKMLPLNIFIYKSDTNQCCYLSFTDFLRATKGLKIVLHNEREPIFEIPCSRFIWEDI